MNTTFSKDDKTMVMAFEGKLDTAASSQVEKDMQVLRDCEGYDIVLDCTHLEYISSSGLRLFLGVVKNAKMHGSGVALRGLSADLLQMFDEIGFTRLFTIEP